MIAATPHNRAGELALDILRATLEAVRGDRLVETHVERVGSLLFLQGLPVDLGGYRRVLVAAAGKAAPCMAASLAEILGPFFGHGIIVAPPGTGETSGFETHIGAHPVPDAHSFAAGRAMREFAESCEEGDLVLFALSGGASALMEDLPAGVEPGDLAEATSALLRAGLDIHTINQVRARVSRLKGGGLARAFLPAKVYCLVLSDVPGGDATTVGSGPFSTRLRRVPLDFRSLEHLPGNLRSYLDLQLPPAQETEVPHLVVGSVSVAVQAAADAARSRGLATFAFSDPMRGEARDMAVRIMGVAEEHSAASSEPLCLVFGGETTVRVVGPGQGGRCQEMAVAAAPHLRSIAEGAFLAAGTDGRDGPTEYAGGLVDPDSLSRALARGQSPETALLDNDASAFLDACQGLIRIGSTQTNVNDVCLFVRS